MTKNILNEADDAVAPRPHNTPFATIAEGRYSRRALLAATATVAGTAALGLPLGPAHAAPGKRKKGLEVAGLSPELKLAPGLHYDVIARWGDAVLPGAPKFDPNNQTAAAQAMQFGEGADFIGFFPQDPYGMTGLLTVNHEFALPEYMFKEGDKPEVAGTKEAVGITQNATGVSVIEVALDQTARRWYMVKPGKYNRRITAAGTPCVVSGPARGSERMKAIDAEDGTASYGTLGNCAGGITPWGTLLTAEENFQFFFRGAPEGAEAETYKRYGVNGEGHWLWANHDPRFDLAANPNGPNLYGWMVEIDPRNPEQPPIKRTALGRFKHEGAGCVVNKDGRVVVYMGDDQNFEYIYRYVSNGRVNSKAHAMINGKLLDDGTLYAAEFTETEIIWHALVHGQGKLTAENGFHNQADVVINARRAADLVGATPMDRPEDIEVNPITGKVYAMLTNNVDRGLMDTNPANPRGPNFGGHVIEMLPPADEAGALDHGADRFGWEMFLRGGKKAGLMSLLPQTGGHYHPDTPDSQWLAAPDNVAFTTTGDMVIATDGMEKADMPDGLFIMDTEGEARALPRRLLAAPIGSEVTGPMFTPDDRTLFCSIQHPGMGSSWAAPSTRWPDFDPALPPRSSVVAIKRKSGAPIR